MNVLDLFSGIGGFSLGLERAGMRTVAFCEREPYCQAVLRKHWPGVPIYDDVCTLTADRLRADGIFVDLICGGFPCQPFSTASRGRRTAVDMWPELFRVITEVLPRWAIIENVQEFPIKRAADAFERLGYRAVYRRIGADEGGADHSRNRWWCVAHANDEGEFYSALNAEVAGLQALCAGVWGWKNYARAIRVPIGIPNRMDRVRALGNSVVPQIPEIIGRAILAREGVTA